jgi:hypothetical protein
MARSWPSVAGAPLCVVTITRPQGLTGVCHIPRLHQYHEPWATGGSWLHDLVAGWASQDLEQTAPTVGECTALDEPAVRAGARRGETCVPCCAGGQPSLEVARCTHTSDISTSGA